MQRLGQIEILNDMRKQGSWRLEDVKSKPWLSCHTSNSLLMRQSLSVKMKDGHGNSEDTDTVAYSRNDIYNDIN